MTLRISILLFAVVAITACSSAVTPSKLGQVADGMTVNEVEQVLGRPTRIDHAEITSLTGDVYHYVSARGDAQVVFVNGTVFRTQFASTGGHA